MLAAFATALAAAAIDVVHVIMVVIVGLAA
jgi:hypothetical protein